MRRVMKSLLLAAVAGAGLLFAAPGSSNADEITQVRHGRYYGYSPRPSYGYYYRPAYPYYAPRYDYYQPGVRVYRYPYGYSAPYYYQPYGQVQVGPVWFGAW